MIDASPLYNANSAPLEILLSRYSLYCGFNCWKSCFNIIFHFLTNWRHNVLYVDEVLPGNSSPDIVYVSK